MLELQVRERAVLVTVLFRRAAYLDPWPAEEVAAELRELARSAGVEIVAERTVVREAPMPGLLVGQGKAEELHALVEDRRADTVALSCDLSPSQQRNLEEVLGVKVIDRTQLILDIFAQRAHSQEGKVQVALAQHQYLLPRLVGKGILLSRLGGGIGTRGPGEQKLEVDRRRIRARITRLQQELAAIRARRRQIRRDRALRDTPTLALVGYTNAGKTTLLNALTRAHAVAEDQLFTTLDPMARRLVLPSRQAVIVSDTVGFLHRLPHRLIEAFQATLEEVREAHLLLHVIDTVHPLREEQIMAVEQVLRELEAEEKPRLVVYNKIDRASPEERRGLQRTAPEAVLISALTGEGVASLMERMAHALTSSLVPVAVNIPQRAQGWIHRIYEEGLVSSRRDLVSGVRLDVLVPPALKGLLEKAGFLA